MYVLKIQKTGMVAHFPKFTLFITVAAKTSGMFVAKEAVLND